MLRFQINNLKINVGSSDFYSTSHAITNKNNSMRICCAIDYLLHAVGLWVHEDIREVFFHISLAFHFHVLSGFNYLLRLKISLSNRLLAPFVLTLISLTGWSSSIPSSLFRLLLWKISLFKFLIK